MGCVAPYPHVSAAVDRMGKHYLAVEDVPMFTASGFDHTIRNSIRQDGSTFATSDHRKGLGGNELDSSKQLGVQGNDHR